MRKGFPLVIICIIAVTAMAGLPCHGLAVVSDTFRASVVAGIVDTNRDGTPDGFYDSSAIDSEYYIQQNYWGEIRNITEYDLSDYLGMTLTTANLKMGICANNGYGARYREYNIYLYAGNGQADLDDFSATAVLLDTLSYNLDQDIQSVTAYIDILDYAQLLLDDSITFVGIRVDPVTEDDYGTVVGHYQEYFDNYLTIEAIPEPSSFLLLGLGAMVLKRKH